MSTKAPKVALLEEFGDEQKEAFLAALPSGSTLVGPSDMAEATDITVLVTWSSDIDRTILNAHPNLQVVIKLDSGPGKIPVKELEAGGIAFETASSPALVSVAEHTVMLILAVFKRFGPALDRTRARTWAAGISPILTNQEEYSYNWVGLEKFEAITGKKVGLVGLGRIGLEVARLLNAFGCTVIYTKRNRLSDEDESALNLQYLPFDDLLAESDCVSLHNRFDDSTEKMMGTKQFDAMKFGSFFVNTARGRLVDEQALTAALESGKLAGAAIDVAWYEPPLEDSGLWTTPNLIITPHSAGIPIGVSLVEELTEAGELITQKWALGE